MKITMNINDELLERVDRYAKINYMNRTSVFSVAVNEFLIKKELPALMKNMNQAMIKIAETGEITDEDREALDAMDLLVNAMMGAAGEND